MNKRHLLTLTSAVTLIIGSAVFATARAETTSDTPSPYPLDAYTALADNHGDEKNKGHKRGNKRRGGHSRMWNILPHMADDDGDGNVSVEEFRAALEEHFADADANGDGKLNKDELASKINALMAEAAAASSIAFGDLDDDKALSLDEIWEHLQDDDGDFMLDRNNDGMLNEQDRRRWFR